MPRAGDYQQWLANTQLEQRVSLDDYSVSNRGLRSGLVGTTPLADRIGESERAGVHLVLLQVSPQMEEMERFSKLVISHMLSGQPQVKIRQTGRVA